jgi:hypothetical protein
MKPWAGRLTGAAFAAKAKFPFGNLKGSAPAALEMLFV